MTTTNTVATKEGFAEVKAAKLSTLGFFMALPPVLVIILFVGLPILVAFAFSIGYTGGPNEVISIIGQDIYTKNSLWGTADAYLAVFRDPRFVPDFVLTMVVTFVSTFVVLVMAMGMGLYQRIKGGKLAAVLSMLSLVPLFVPVVIAAYAIAQFYNGVGFMRTFMSQFGI